MFSDFLRATVFEQFYIEIEMRFKDMPEMVSIIKVYDVSVQRFGAFLDQVLLVGRIASEAGMTF